MIVKVHELGKIKIAMEALTRTNYQILYINSERSQIIRNDHAMDYDTASEIFDYLVEESLKVTDTKKEEDTELFTKEQFDKILEDLEQDDK